MDGLRRNPRQLRGRRSTAGSVAWPESYWPGSQGRQAWRPRPLLQQTSNHYSVAMRISVLGDRNHAFRQLSRRALIYMPRWDLHFDLRHAPPYCHNNKPGRTTLFVV